MIIIKNHFNNVDTDNYASLPKDTAIYANIISNGCQTFPIEQLDKVCQEFDVPDHIKDDVLIAFNQNQGADDVNEDIFDKLQELNNRTLNHAVAFATKNQNLLEKLLISADMELRDIIASREILNNNLVHQLAKDENPHVRITIARRKDLPNEIVINLSFDTDWMVRAHIAKKDNLSLPIIERLSRDEETYVRRHIAMRKNLNETIIERLAKDEDAEIRRIIAEKENLNDALMIE